MLDFWEVWPLHLEHDESFFYNLITLCSAVLSKKACTDMTSLVSEVSSFFHLCAIVSSTHESVVTFLLFISFIFLYCAFIFLCQRLFFFFKGKCLTLLYNIMLKKGKKEELFWVYTGYSYHPFWVVRVVETLLVLTCSEDVTYLIDTIVQCTASRTSLGGWCEATVTKLLRAVALAEVLNVVSICV